MIQPPEEPLDTVSAPDDVAHSRYLRNLLGTIAAGLALIGGLNAALDPSFVSDPGRAERDVARLMAAGQNAEVRGKFDDRLLRRLVAEMGTPQPHTLVVGSSRTIVLTSASLGGRPLHNASVPGCKTEDFVALYWLYAMRPPRPKTMVVALDPWLLNATSHLATGDALLEPYAAAAAALGIEGSRLAGAFGLAHIPGKLGALFSWSSLVYSLTTSRSGAEEPAFVRPATRTPTPDTHVRRADGSVDYWVMGPRPPAKSLQIALRDAASGVPPYMEGYDGPDRAAVRQLGAVLSDARKADIRVVAYLAPYHPAFWSRLPAANRERYLAGPERELRRLAGAHGVEVVGAYDPAACGCSDDAFDDTMHPGRGCLERVMATTQW